MKVYDLLNDRFRAANHHALGCNESSEVGLCCVPDEMTAPKDVIIKNN